VAQTRYIIARFPCDCTGLRLHCLENLNVGKGFVVIVNDLQQSLK